MKSAIHLILYFNLYSLTYLPLYKDTPNYLRFQSLFVKSIANSPSPI